DRLLEAFRSADHLQQVMEGVAVENPVDYPSGLRESASGTGPSLARGTPRDHAQGYLGRQPGRARRECRLSVQQEAPAGDRPAGALSAQVSGIPEGGGLPA